MYAATYQGGLCVIEKDKKYDLNIPYTPVNGGFRIKDKMYFFDLKDVFEVNNKFKFKTSFKNLQCYFGKVSKDKKSLYLGATNRKGLWKFETESFYKNEPKFITFDSISGLKMNEIYTIVEDKYNRIWCSGINQGFVFVNPNDNKVTHFKKGINNNFGAIASVEDKFGGLWFGGVNSHLYFVNGNNKKIKNKDFIKINHPLLNSSKKIMSLLAFENFIIIGAYDKILILNLEEFYKNNKILLKYINPNESNFSSFIEQNTIVIAKDKTIWFSTSDNLYQWDIKKWLSLPTFKIVPTILIEKDSIETEFKAQKCIHFKPTENSFDIQIKYQTKDNMPRFINGLLVKKGEKPVFENPNLETKFQIKNISAGDYVFYVRVCQQDGSFTIFQYPITVDSFVWQKWWFWLLLMLPFFAVLVYFFQKRNQIEKQKKKLSQLNLSSLSNQFRPHFMLNALNSIGSQMQDKPHAEKVISRLGESINILYGFTQKSQFTLPFGKEWKLVENSIEIQRLLFMPDLNYILKNINLISDEYKIPVGLLQIPVENALLHGLRNKTDGNCILEIDFEENETHYFINIMDNGVGRENALRINNFKKNGNGLKTIHEMITIINQHQKNAIVFEIIDREKPSGTIVKITLNKNIDYDKIKI